jgi:hypothetical protein
MDNDGSGFPLIDKDKPIKPSTTSFKKLPKQKSTQPLGDG